MPTATPIDDIEIIAFRPTESTKIIETRIPKIWKNCTKIAAISGGIVSVCWNIAPALTMMKECPENCSSATRTTPIIIDFFAAFVTAKEKFSLNIIAVESRCTFFLRSSLLLALCIFSVAIWMKFGTAKKRMRWKVGAIIMA